MTAVPAFSLRPPFTSRAAWARTRSCAWATSSTAFSGLVSRAAAATQAHPAFSFMLYSFLDAGWTTILAPDLDPTDPSACIHSTSGNNAQQFDLMFASSIGPTGQHTGQPRTPFRVSLGGQELRNDISPRAELAPPASVHSGGNRAIRARPAREDTQVQAAGQTTARRMNDGDGTAVAQDFIANETLG
ncbi:hypothetical protein DFH06DRAFT_1325524 [Mycena polygramma]|nr:hypothetical protein DFH06DRAFT_1325524 [Mycena polygramma]